MACRLTHHHILPKELLDSPALAARLCPKARNQALIALTTATIAVAAYQPEEDPEPKRMAVLDPTTARRCTGEPRAGQHTDREQSEGTKVLRLPEVRKRTGLSHATIWRMERADQFPKRVRLATRAVGWREAEVESWLVSRSRERAG